MSIETANYISQWNPAIPADTDPVSETSAILRQVKTVLQNQFTSLGANPVTVTATQINQGVAPFGAIIMFAAGLTVPTGWHVCDGSTVAKSDGSGNVTLPNLVDRFIVGAGNLYSAGSTGGSTTVTPTITVGGTALSVANLPSSPIVTLHDSGHNHTLHDPGHHHTTGVVAGVANNGFSISAPWSDPASNPINTSTNTTGITIDANGTGITLTSNGTDTPHAHTASSSTVSTLSPYYALVFIMKI
jgi:hypothetical protein